MGNPSFYSILFFVFKTDLVDYGFQALKFVIELGVLLVFLKAIANNSMYILFKD